MDAAPPLISALLSPQAYGHAVKQVELVQTHISWVLLAGTYAYKIKQPLRLPFLDYSTLALRRQACEDELRLNRRFAPELYLDVVPIVVTPAGPRVDAPGEPIEYAVRMHRFDEAARLDHVCARGELEPHHLSALAVRLCTFHAGTPVAAPDAPWGAPEAIMAPMRDNFSDLYAMADDPTITAALDGLRAWSESEFARLRPLLEERRNSGRIRECHGDLHLGNLVLLHGQVRMYDCIEFNAALRWIDVVSELAFTYVDLLAHGQPGLACWLLNEVWSHNGDYAAAPLLRFYAVYRALVRAKVALMRRARPGDNGTAAREALDYLTLAQRLCQPTAPRLVITHGVSGCGKTHLSDRLLQNNAGGSTVRLRSDVERKRLQGVAAEAHSGSATGAGLYTEDWSERTYARLHVLAAQLLASGWSVLVDATFLKRAQRARFVALAQEQGVPFAILAPQAEPATLRHRIQTRLAQGKDASEATLAVLEQQLARIEPLDANERACVLDDGALAATLLPQAPGGIAQ